MDRKKLLDVIEEFFDKRDESEGNPDYYDKVSDNDMITLYTIFNSIINHRFKRDVYGSLPINYQLVDRNVGNFILYNNTLPYTASNKNLRTLTSAINTISAHIDNNVMIITENE